MLSTAVIIVKVCLFLGGSSYLFGVLLQSEERRWVHAKPLWLITLAFPVALLLPSIWILLGLAIILPLLLARDRGEAAALSVVALLALPAMSVPIAVAGMSILTLSTYNCLSIGLLIASFALKGTAKLGRGSFDLAFYILILLNLIASARGLNVTSTLREIVQVLLNFALPYWAIRRSITRPEDLNRIMVAFCFAGVVLSVIAFYEAQAFWPIYEMLPTHFGMPPTLSQSLKVRAGLMRGNATFPESTSFAWLLAICLVVTIVTRDRFFRGRLHWWVALAMIVAGLLATQARGGWIAAIVGLILVDAYRRRWSVASIKLAVIAVLYASLSVLSRSTGMLEETLGKTGGAASTVDYRQDLWRRGLQEIAKHPWMGTDIATATSHLEDMRQGEGIIDFVNAYIYYGLTTGVIGVALFAVAFLLSVICAARLREKSKRPSLASDAGAVGFAASGFTAISAGTSGFGGSASTFYFIVLAIIAAAYSVKLAFPPKGSVKQPVPSEVPAASTTSLKTRRTA